MCLFVPDSGSQFCNAVKGHVVIRGLLDKRIQASGANRRTSLCLSGGGQLNPFKSGPGAGSQSPRITNGEEGVGKRAFGATGPSLACYP